ncbi:MAG TPA: hypothetical protein VIN72_04120 [Lutibacter sp.]
MCNDSNGCYIVFWLNGKRYRLKSGALIEDATTNLNNYPKNMRQGKAAILADKVISILSKTTLSFPQRKYQM